MNIVGAAPAWPGAPVLVCHPAIRALNAGRCPLCDPAHPFETRREVIDLVDETAALEREENEARAELARLDRDAAYQSLAEFVRQAWHVLEPVELEWSWHHDALCANVQGMLEEWLRVRAERDEMRRTRKLRAWRQRWQKLVINICPGTLKSRIVMVFAVAWMWLHCPQWSVLCVSANPENVRRDAESCRDLITSMWYRLTFAPTWELRDDIDSKGKFQLSSGGFRMSKGMSGKFTGFHVDAVLMDDPDDAHDVHSEAERKARKGKVESISSRFNDKRHMIWIVIQQRVHVDDCTGDLLARGGWLHAQYPLHYDPERRVDTPFFIDPRGTTGQNMHDVRFTAEVITAARLELGSQGFDAQYECNPAPEGGNLIKLGWFRFFRVAQWTLGLTKRPTGAWTGDPDVLELDEVGRLRLDWLTISVDATFGSTSDTASAVSCQVIGGLGVKRYVFLDDTKPRTFSDTVTVIANLITIWQPRVRCAMRILVEKKANGAAVIEVLAREFQGLIPVEPDGGKEARASAMSPAVESGCVYLLEGAAWLDEYLTGQDSVPVFPHGKRDDRMDSLSQAMNYHRADLDAMRLEAKNRALMSIRAAMGARAGFGV